MADYDDVEMVDVLTTAVPSCIIHCLSCEDDVYSNLASPRDFESWNTLFEAARIRKFSPVLELATMAGEGVIPDICYHSQCRSVFTLKKTLEALEPPFVSTNVQPMAPPRLRRQVGSGSSPLLDSNCIFCGKVSKYTPIGQE